MVTREEYAVITYYLYLSISTELFHRSLEQ